MLGGYVPGAGIGVAILPERCDDYVGFIEEPATGNFPLQELLYVRWKVLGKHVKYSRCLDRSMISLMLPGISHAVNSVMASCQHQFRRFRLGIEPENFFAFGFQQELNGFLEAAHASTNSEVLARQLTPSGRGAII